MSEQLSAVTVMDSCIDDIKTWMLNDKLKLNDGKTDFFIIGTRQQLEKVDFDTLRIGDSYVTASSEAKDLGFWLDSQMKCDTNVNSSSYFILERLRYPGSGLRIRVIYTYPVIGERLVT